MSRLKRREALKSFSAFGLAATTPTILKGERLADQYKVLEEVAEADI